MTDILISQDVFGCKVAVLENNEVCEILHENSSMVGSIYLGVVVRVVSTLGVAFVDIGEKRTAFLSYKTNLPYQGERLIVQVIKDPYDSKGATVSTNIRLSSRYLVYLPQDDFVTASTKLAKNDKTHLTATIETIIAKHNIDGGFIVRHHAKDLNSDELLTNIQALHSLWKQILSQKSKFPASLYTAPSLPYRMVMDMKTGDTVLIDNPSLFQALNHFALSMTPSLMASICQYSKEAHLFQQYGVYDAQNQALNRTVSLPSGGSLVIDECEAMTVIDVNTGAFTGNNPSKNVILQTNLEAAYSIVRQLRLRNIGGIILIDFINMKKEVDYKNLISTFKQELNKDPKTKFIGTTQLGLVELTRERSELSMSKKLCTPCPTCNGVGFVRGYELLLSQLVHELTKKIKLFQSITIKTSSNFIAYLYAHEHYMAWIESLECDIHHQATHGLMQDYQILYQ